jgi:hypothetical protein
LATRALNLSVNCLGSPVVLANSGRGLPWVCARWKTKAVRNPTGRRSASFSCFTTDSPALVGVWGSSVSFLMMGDSFLPFINNPAEPVPSMDTCNMGAVGR